jgi:hypothetical protein
VVICVLSCRPEVNQANDAINLSLRRLVVVVITTAWLARPGPA